jgi:hypothetical protein
MEKESVGAGFGRSVFPSFKEGVAKLDGTPRLKIVDALCESQTTVQTIQMTNDN